MVRGEGILDVTVFAIGAALLVALARSWVLGLRRRTGAAYALATFAVFAVPLATRWQQLPLDYLYRFPPWAQSLDAPTMPGNPTLTDVALQMVPFRHLVRARLLQLDVPLWAHELGTGQPLLGNAQSAPLAPLHLMALPAPPRRAMTLAAAWQVLVALLGTHLLLRELGATGSAAALGALAFSLSSFAFAWLYYPLGMTAAWVPAVALGLLRLFRGEPRAWPGLALAGAALALSGHPTMLAHSVVVFGSATLVALFGQVGSRGRVLRELALATALATACAVPFLLPVIADFPHSERATQERLGKLPAPAPSGCALATVVQPYACGSPRDGNWSGPTGSNFSERATAYAGLVPLALAVAGALSFGGLPRASLLVGAAFLALAVGFGSLPPAGLPAFLAGANQGRLRLFWILAVAIAAALATRPVRERSPSRWLACALLVAGAAGAHLLRPAAESAWQEAWRWIVSLGLLAVTATLALPAWRRAFPLLALVVTAADLLLANARFNPLVPAHLDLEPPPVVRFLQERAHELPPFRVHGGEGRFLPYLPAIYGLWDARGYDPMRPGAAAQLMRRRIGEGRRGGMILQGPLIDTPFLSFLGVRFLLDGESAPSPWRPVFAGTGGVVWENPDSRGIFFVPPTIVPAASRAAALRFAAAASDLANAPRVEGIARARSGQRGSARLVEAGSERLRVELDGPVGTVIASSITWMPGWRYDERTVDLVRVNGAFLGLVKRVPEEVVTELRYQPATWRLGWIVSATLLGGLALRADARRRRRRR